MSPSKSQPISWPSGMKGGTVAYVEGWYAYGRGESHDSCRFDGEHFGASRDWHRGWHDAKQAGFVDPSIQFVEKMTCIRSSGCNMPGGCEQYGGCTGIGECSDPECFCHGYHPQPIGTDT